MWQLVMWILILCIVIALGVSLWYEAGGKIKANCAYQWIKKTEQKRILETISRKDAGMIFLYAILFRFVIYLFSIIFIIYENQGIHSFQDFLIGWKRWDASNYLSIAEFGYADSLVDGRPLFLVFFPFYSYLIRFLNIIVQNYMVSALLVSCMTYGIACVYFYKLVALDYGKDTAKNAVILISIFPFSFFFGSMMSESTFFMLSVLVLYYARLHKWHLAGLIGIFACMTRMHGILLLVPVFIEWILYYKPLSLWRKKAYRYLWKAVVAKAIWIPVMILGILYYLWVNYDVTNNPFQFTIYQKENWHQGPCIFTNTLEYVFKNAFFQDTIKRIQLSVWIPEALLFILGIIIILYGIRRYRISYVSYLFVYLLLNYSVTWLLSGGRYMSCAVPMFLIAGGFMTKHPKSKMVICFISIALFTIYLGWHIGWEQVM